MAVDKLFYFSQDEHAWADGRHAWWEYVFYHGETDRDDKVVDWVIREYSPGDNLQRYPLRVRRNTWLVPSITKAGISLVVSEEVRSRIVAASPHLEFLEVSFERLYEVPWGGGIASVLHSGASDQEIQSLTKSYESRSTEIKSKYFEMICPRSGRCGPVPDRPWLKIYSELLHTREASRSNYLITNLDLSAMVRFGAIYHSGAGLICNREINEILTGSSGLSWFASDELAYTVVGS